MRRLAAALGFALRRGARAVRRRAGATAWAALAVAAAMVALGAARLVEHNLTHLTASWRGGVDMVVYLDDAIEPARVEALAAALRRVPAVERVEHVAPTEALGALREALGEEGALLDGVEPGLVPASLEVALAPGVEDVAATHPFVDRLRATPGVEDVEFVGEWVERADTLTAGLRRGGGAVVALAALLALVLTASAVRLAVAGRRGDGRVLDLLGATAAFQRGPSVVHGVAIGLLGALLAIAVLAIGYREIAAPASIALGAVVPGGAVAFLPLADLALLVAAGAALGALGGVLAGAPRGIARA